MDPGGAPGGDLMRGPLHNPTARFFSNINNAHIHTCKLTPVSDRSDSQMTMSTARRSFHVSSALHASGKRRVSARSARKKKQREDAKQQAKARRKQKEREQQRSRPVP